MNTRLACLLWQPDNWTTCQLLGVTALTVVLFCRTGFSRSVDVQCSDLWADLCISVPARWVQLTSWNQKEVVFLWVWKCMMPPWGEIFPKGHFWHDLNVFVARADCSLWALYTLIVLILTQGMHFECYGLKPFKTYTLKWEIRPQDSKNKHLIHNGSPPFFPQPHITKKCAETRKEDETEGRQLRGL